MRMEVFSILITLMLATCSHCYKIGSPVPLLIRTPDGTVEALRSHMPLFGIPTAAEIETASLAKEQSRKKMAASLAFGGGASASFGERAVSAPWVDVLTSEKALERLTVTFVYCRDGDLHSVSSSASFVDLKTADEDALAHFRVEYLWVEEADVDLAGGLTVMTGVVVLVSLVILVRSCASMDEDPGEGDTAYGSSQDQSYGGYTAGPSWKGQ